MLALVHVSSIALTDSPSMVRLSTLAADHRLVLVCVGHSLAMAVVSRLRRVLPSREVVTLVVDAEVAAEERMLIEELLRAGAVPLILTADMPSAELLMTGGWLAADKMLRLPKDAGPS